MYMEVVTVHIRTVDVINSITESGSQNVDKNIRNLFTIDEAFLAAFLVAVSMAYPPHASFPDHPHVAPAKLILYYVDKQQGRAFYKYKLLQGTFTVNGQAITVVADATPTSNNELRDMRDASDLFKFNLKELRKEELVSLLILRDFRKVAADKTSLELCKEHSHEAFMLDDEDDQMQGGDVTNDLEAERREANDSPLEATHTIENELKALKTENEVLRNAAKKLREQVNMYIAEDERLTEKTRKLELMCGQLRSTRKELQATLATTARQLRASQATSMYYVPGLPTPRPYNTRRSLTGSGPSQAQTRG